MFGCIKFRIFYKKHALLIRNCYPLKEGHDMPRSAELSYLTFYASSRPAKLTKVGAYLCKKVKRDIRKGRKSNNKVSLHILKALIQSCHHDISLFGRSVIFILIIILDTRDIELIDLACDTFCVFCSNYEKSSLSVDSIFINEYDHLLQRFSQFAVYPNDDLELGLKMKYCGHRALAAIAQSLILSSIHTKKQYTIILPPLLSTISSSTLSIKELMESDPVIHHHASVFSIDHLSLEWIQKLAVKTLSTLFSQSNGPGVKMLFDPCKEYFDVSNRWWPTDFCVSIMELMLESLQSKHRYLLLSYALYSLDQPLEKNNTSQLDQFAGFIAIITMILTSPTSLMGISTLELLNALYNLMSKSINACGKLYIDDGDHEQLQQPQIEENHEKEKQMNDQKHRYIQKNLFNSAVGFGSQFYYSNQWSDIVGYIITKIQTNSISSTLTASTTDHNTLLRLASIHYLDRFQKNTSHSINQDSPITTTSTTTSDNNNSSIEFSVDPWIPGLNILTDLNSDIRIAFADTLIYFLSTSLSQMNLEIHHHSNVKFIDHLLKTIKVWIQLDNLNDKDMMAIYQLLYCISTQFKSYGFIRTIPFIFTLQDIAQGKDSIHLTLSQQRGLAFVTLYWMVTVAKKLSLNQLLHYVHGVNEKRRELQQVSTIDFTIQPISKLHSIHEVIIDEKDQEEIIITEWMDRNTAIEAILNDQKMKSDTNNNNITSSDLLSKLSLNYGSDNYENEEKAFRIQTNLDIPLTPKITPSLTPKLMKHKQQQSEKQVINVENLKGALGM
ncbi:hypothetical protein BJ944DRAFT_264788 [Cunninghamella echinulata]|nr:hypothetical protein BJ944DRAFT_264788 [Cunninghamella echinulata]